MPVAKPKASNVTDVVKAEEGNDSIGKEPLPSFSRNGNSSVQWIQLLQALDQQDLHTYKGHKECFEHVKSLKIFEAVLATAQAIAKFKYGPENLPGWPLVTPLKVQMQKCDKCSQEFCSTINCRRHIRVFHRLKKLDKDSTKSRDLLGAFWDKLSVDEAKEIVSFKNAALEGVPGSSIIKSLTAVIRKPGFSSLPQVCLRTGAALLDIVQARPSRWFPISSQELFSILDDASEKTFLCGTAVSMQKYIFEGETGKIGLETRNLVACTSFMVEQILIKAWLADKDAEALRCQKLLVEEEEASQRRQAELLERRRQKKLRLKEQRPKEQRHEEKADDKEIIGDMLEPVPPPETSSPLGTSDSEGHNADVSPNYVPSSFEPVLFANSEEDVDCEVQTSSGDVYTDFGTEQNVEQRMVQGSGRRHIVLARRQVPPKSRGLPNGFHASQNSWASNLGGIQKHRINRDIRSAPTVNGNKVWSRKPKPESDCGIVKTRVPEEVIDQLEQSKSHEVLIGSICVTLGNCNQHEGKSPVEIQDDCMVEYQMLKKNNFLEKPKPDPIQCAANSPTVKFWRPVSWRGIKGPVPDQNGIRESEANVNAGQDGDQTLCNENLRSMDDNCGLENSSSFIADSIHAGSMQFRSHAAKAFLSERWKEAIAAEHVKLVLTPESESSGYEEIQSECEVAAFQSSNFHKRGIFSHAENRSVNATALETLTMGAGKAPNFRLKPEKGANIKYIPKQRIDT